MDRYKKGKQHINVYVGQKFESIRELVMKNLQNTKNTFK